MQIRIINAPEPSLIQMLQRRVPPQSRNWLGEHADAIASIGLVQVTVADLFFYADIAEKAADVFTTEVAGSCPTHISTLAVVGETSAVRMAMENIEAAASAAAAGSF